MAVKILYVMLAVLIMAACYVLGFKFGMRRGKKITLAVQAEIRRRGAGNKYNEEYIPSLRDIFGSSHAVRPVQEKKETC